jgi:acetyl esterase/lipase
MSLDRPPYDPELAALLEIDEMAAMLDFVLDLEQIDEIRAQRKAYESPIETVLEGTGLEHTERVVPGPRGSVDITLSIVRDPGASEPAPCVYYLHGGGMVGGDRFVGVRNWVPWIQRFGVTVVSVEYRLAPENPYPAPVEDCYAGLLWVVENSAEIGIDAGRVLLAGASAGAGLAAAVALLARDRGGPRLIGQLLLAPMLDDRDQSVSSHQFGDAPIWSRASNRTGWSALLGPAKGGFEVPPYAAPARATDLSNLPPAYIEVGSAEVFRDEDVDYASRLWAAGVQAELHVWAGGFHGFTNFDHTRLSRAAKEATLSWMARILEA